MTARVRTALLLGGSGLVGNELLSRLLVHEGYLRVRAVVRSPLGVEHPKLHQIVAPLDRPGELAGECEADDIYCCLGTTLKTAGSEQAFRNVDHDLPLAFARITSSKNARQFLLVSSTGAHAGSSILYLRVKGETERDVSAQPFHAVHIFRPSMLLGRRKERRWEDTVVAPVLKALNGVMIGGLKKYRPVPAAVVARAMLVAAWSDGAAGTHVYESDAIQLMGREKG
jgi:uncharacterized protein YbjT (DUF2867 family)